MVLVSVFFFGSITTDFIRRKKKTTSLQEGYMVLVSVPSNGCIRQLHLGWFHIDGCFNGWYPLIMDGQK